MTHVISKDFLLSYSTSYPSGYFFQFELKKEINELNKNIQLLREEIKEIKNIIKNKDEEFGDYDFLPKINNNSYK